MISISPQVATLKKGETLKLTVTKDFEGEVSYVSTNENIIKVDEEGTVTAIGVSSAYVTALSRGPKGIESATMRVDVPGLMITPSVEKHDIKINTCMVFSILKKHPANFDVVPSIEDELILGVNKVGSSSFRVRGLLSGTSKLTFNLIDPSVEVTEDDPEANVIDSVSYDISVGTIEELFFNQKSLTCELNGNEVDIPITIKPSESDFKLTSSNEDVFKITKGNKGVPTGLGSSILTVRKYNLSDQCTIKVIGLQVTKNGTLSVGHRIILNVECTEKGSPIFESNNNEVATVDKYGIVTGVSEGKVQIVVTVGKYSKTLELEVIPYFTPISELTDEIKRTIKIFTSYSELRAYAKGRVIIESSILDGLIPISYIKTNEDPNVFEYELAILDKDLTRYNSINLPNKEDEPSGNEITINAPDNLVVNKETIVPVTLKSVKGANKVRVQFNTEGPGNAFYKMTDSLDNPFEFENSGFWGPEEGFDMPENYEATTECSIRVDAEGTYKFSIALLSVESGETLASFEYSIDALSE